jgi:predicted nucleic acid-binding protein
VYLAALGDFELLRHLFGSIAIPQAVFEKLWLVEQVSR